jgi:hypothetical protein
VHGLSALGALGGGRHPESGETRAPTAVGMGRAPKGRAARVRFEGLGLGTINHNIEWLPWISSIWTGMEGYFDVAIWDARSQVAFRRYGPSATLQ